MLFTVEIIVVAKRIVDLEVHLFEYSFLRQKRYLCVTLYVTQIRNQKITV